MQNRINVLNAFEASAEFQTLVSTLYGTSTSDNERTEHFVNNFYVAALGVNATPSQLQQQRERLNSAAALGYANVQAEAEAMGRELLASQVTNFSINETQFVTNLYEAFLQRGPDAGGLAFWVSNAGTNNATQRQNVLNAFATCGSFRDLAGTLYREVFWLVADQLGTPRMVVDKSGSLASVKRHDYLPFGEEIGGPQVGLIGGRATTPGYVGDSVRQKFTGYESDGETGLNYAQARYQSSVQGRFTSVDPLGRSATITNPQSFNRYSYVLNSPTKLTDPLGLMWDHDMDHNGAEPSSSDNDPPGDPFEKGSDIVAAGMAKFDRRVADTIFANGLNQLISSGRMTRDQAEGAIKGNDNLAIEEVTSSVSEAPQNPQEAITNNATPEQADLLTSGAAEVASRMQVGTCQDFFGSRGLAAFNGIAWTVNPSLPTDGHPQAVSGPGTIVQVNPNGGLLTPDGSSRTFNLVDPRNSKNVFRLTLNGVIARAFGQAHEGGHHARRFGKTDIDDYPKHLLNNYKNNYKIWKACFSEFAPVRWTGRGLPPP